MRIARLSAALLATLLATRLAACAGDFDPGTGGDDDDAPGQPVDAAPPGAADAAVPSPDAAPPAPLPEIEFDHYHDQDEIAAYLRAVAEARPGVVTFEVLGDSAEGREIAAVTINATGQADPPAIFANGTHHGDEKSSTEATLAIIDHLLRNPDDPDVQAVLGTYAVVVVPLVNPDGHEYHTREVSNGTDPNRDYAYPGRSEANSFDLVETQVVKALQDREAFRAAMAFHSGIEEVIWPWCHTGEPTADDAVFAAISQAAAEAMGFDRYMQSYYDYYTTGEYIEYAYMKHGTLAVTFEVSSAKTPSESSLPAVVARSLDGSMAFMMAVHDHDAGLLPLVWDSAPHAGISGGAPVIAGEKKE